MMYVINPAEKLDESLIAESPDLQDYQFTEGFHGTDDWTAIQMIRNGFNQDHYDDTCFSPPDNLWSALQHAEKNAMRQSRARYALLKAQFPLTSISHGSLGLYPCLRFYGEELGNVSIVAMGIFNAADGKLLATYNPDQLDALRQE